MMLHARRDQGRDPFNQNSNRSDREKWSTSKGGPVFSKLFRLDRTDPLSFGPKFPEILVEWIAPQKSGLGSYIFHNLNNGKQWEINETDIVSNRMNHSLFTDPLFSLQSPSCARDNKYLLTASARR